MTKIYDADSLELLEGSREFVAVISTSSPDRDGEVVLPSGLDRKNYAGNPVILSNHKYESLPIGTTRWIKESDGKLIAKGYISDKTQMSRDVWGLMQDGVLNAFSIGFVPKQMTAPTSSEIKSYNWKGVTNVIRKWELLEFSSVAVPCNPEALAMAVAKGYSPEALALITPQITPVVKQEQVSEAIKAIPVDEILSLVLARMKSGKGIFGK